MAQNQKNVRGQSCSSTAHSLKKGWLGGCEGCTNQKFLLKQGRFYGTTWQIETLNSLSGDYQVTTIEFGEFMIRVYFGLLFVGMTTAAHASEEKGGKVLTPQPDQTTTRLVLSGTDFLSPSKPGDKSVVLNRTAVAATADAAPGGAGLGSTSESFSISQSEHETAPATEAARWRKNVGGNRILTLARHKRVEFNGERFKVTLRQDSALIEAGNFKVGLQSGSTLMLWSKAL